MCSSEPEITSHSASFPDIDLFPEYLGVCVCAFSSFWQRTADLGIRHVIPAGCESPVGGDRWSKFLFALVYNSDRQGEEQRAGDSTTEGNAIIEIAKKTSKKKKRYCFKVEEIPKIGSTKGQTVHQHSQEDEKEQKIEYLLVCPKIHLFE